SAARPQLSGAVGEPTGAGDQLLTAVGQPDQPGAELSGAGVESFHPVAQSDDLPAQSPVQRSGEKRAHPAVRVGQLGFQLSGAVPQPDQSPFGSGVDALGPQHALYSGQRLTEMVRRR